MALHVPASFPLLMGPAWSLPVLVVSCYTLLSNAAKLRQMWDENGKRQIELEIKLCGNKDSWRVPRASTKGQNWPSWEIILLLLSRKLIPVFFVFVLAPIHSVCPTSVYCTAIIRRGQERIFPVQHENHLEEGKEGMNHKTWKCVF